MVTIIMAYNHVETVRAIYACSKHQKGKHALATDFFVGVLQPFTSKFDSRVSVILLRFFCVFKIFAGAW